MKKLFIKIIFLSIPVLVLTSMYFYLDPFKVLYKYESFYRSGVPSYVSLNNDYVSTQTFLNNSTKYKYDAFIFGNSRSIFYEIDTWEKYIKTDNCFHFDASGETLLGIKRKISFLNRNHSKISHALIFLDYSTLSQTEEKKGHLFISHPILSNQNWFSFQLAYFKTFFSPKFLITYLDFTFSHKVKDYMKEGHLLDDDPFDYTLKYNEMRFGKFEKLIKDNPLVYYDQKKMSLFFARDTIQKYSDPIIHKTQYKMLSEISNILKNNNTKYKIIINPLYDQMKLNDNDIKLLKNIFGTKNVFDFSGINFITNDYHNYYETSHYRPHIADFIMKEIYK
ncbi:MAG TPA: hypothetical protein VIV55_12590 [Flavobacterium sp.]